MELSVLLFKTPRDIIVNMVALLGFEVIAAVSIIFCLFWYVEKRKKLEIQNKKIEEQKNYIENFIRPEIVNEDIFDSKAYSGYSLLRADALPSYLKFPSVDRIPCMYELDHNKKKYCYAFVSCWDDMPRFEDCRNCQYLMKKGESFVALWIDSLGKLELSKINFPVLVKAVKDDILFFKRIFNLTPLSHLKEQSGRKSYFSILYDNWSGKVVPFAEKILNDASVIDPYYFGDRSSLSDDMNKIKEIKNRLSDTERLMAFENMSDSCFLWVKLKIYIEKMEHLLEENAKEMSGFLISNADIEGLLFQPISHWNFEKVLKLRKYSEKKEYALVINEIFEAFSFYVINFKDQVKNNFSEDERQLILSNRFLKENLYVLI